MWLILSCPGWGSKSLAHMHMQCKILNGPQNMNRKAKVIGNSPKCLKLCYGQLGEWLGTSSHPCLFAGEHHTQLLRIFFLHHWPVKRGGWLLVLNRPPIEAQFCAFQVIASAFPIMFWGLFGIFQNLPEFCFFILGIIRLTSLYIIFQDLKQTCADNEFFPAICLTGPIKPAQS